MFEQPTKSQHLPLSKQHNTIQNEIRCLKQTAEWQIRVATSFFLFSFSIEQESCHLHRWRCSFAFAIVYAFSSSSWWSDEVRVNLAERKPWETSKNKDEKRCWSNQIESNCQNLQMIEQEKRTREREEEEEEARVFSVSSSYFPNKQCVIFFFFFFFIIIASEKRFFHSCCTTK